MAEDRLNDQHIVHRLVDRIALREPESSSLLRAVRRSKDPHLTRQARRELLRAALLDWLREIESQLDGLTLESAAQFRDFILSRFPENRFPPVRPAEIHAIRNLQRTENVPPHSTPEEARSWLQSRHVFSLQAWYKYLLSADAAQELKDIPWFRAMVLHTISTSVPHLEERLDRGGNATHEVRQLPRRPDTRDLLPECDPGNIAVAFDKLYDRLTSTRHNPARKQQQFFPNWDVNFFELYAEASRESKEALEQFKGSIKPNSWLTVTDPDFLAAVSVKTPWCLRSRRTAKHFLTPVDGRTAVVFVYFDELRNPGIGLHAIKVNDSLFEIRQLRGSKDQQELTDPSLVKALELFVTPELFVNAGVYKEQIADHRSLITLEEHMALGTNPPNAVLRSLLITLYNTHRRVKPFGYSRRDNRQRALLKLRKASRFADMEIIFGAGSVATTLEETRNRPETNAYFGPIQPDAFFAKLPQRIGYLVDQASDARVPMHTITLLYLADRSLPAKPSQHSAKQNRRLVLKPMEQKADVTAQVVFITINQLFGGPEERTRDEIIERARQLGLTAFPDGMHFILSHKLRECPFPVYRSDIIVSGRMLALEHGRTASGSTRRFLVSPGGDVTPEETWGHERRFAFVRHSFRKDELEHLRQAEKAWVEILKPKA